MAQLASERIKRLVCFSFFVCRLDLRPRPSLQWLQMHIFLMLSLMSSYETPSNALFQD